MVEVSLTIPIYNEEKCIGRTVVELADVFEKNNIDYELVLINHGSKDRSAEILNKLAEKNKRMKVYNLPKNLGFGGGIMFGFSQSKGKFIGFDCADGEIPPEETFRVFLEARKDRYDLVKGRRTHRQITLFRKFTSLIYNILTGIRLNFKIKDLNGYPIFMRKDKYEKIKPKRSDFIFNYNLYINAKNIGYSIVEVPVKHRTRVAGISSVTLFGAAKMWWNLLEYSFS